ncbi:MAG TPA: hypothetical protein VHS06_09770 [Chloroflexota bacterium]|nr:hypothetical protein [Chloroflexota bacterium]
MLQAEGAPGRPSALAAWLGVATGPIAWTIHLVVCYLLVPYACETGNSWVFHMTTGLTGGATFLAGYLAYRAWRQSEVGLEADASDWSGTERLTRRLGFMGILGLFLSIVFFALILAESAGTVALSPCQNRQYGGEASHQWPDSGRGRLFAQADYSEGGVEPPIASRRAGSCAPPRTPRPRPPQWIPAAVNAGRKTAIPAPCPPPPRRLLPTLWAGHKTPPYGSGVLSPFSLDEPHSTQEESRHAA